MSINLIESFTEFKDGKNIDRPTMVRVLEDVFRSLIRKKFGSDENFDVIVNTNTGDLEMWKRLEIVPYGEVEDPSMQISVIDAQKIESDYEIGEECYEQLFLADFGRRAIMAARQTLISRILELEKDEVYKRYKDREGDIVLGEVHQILKKEMLLLDDATGNELILPRSEMIRGDFFRKGDMVRGIIRKVELKNNNPVIIVSRTDNSFLEKLLEQEVPEIEDGLIVVKRIVRQPGERAKVAVESYDDRIDPVGACVGMKGSRIHGIVRELRNENIDIINFTNNESLLIQRALTPSKITSIDLNQDDRRASVYLRPDQVSLAIGKGGLNIKLASRLTGYDLDVYRDTDDDTEYDIDLDEFDDEIEAWVIQMFKGVGLDTARSILEEDREVLIRRTDLEEETIDHVLTVIKKEFKDEVKEKAPSKTEEE